MLSRKVKELIRNVLPREARAHRIRGGVLKGSFIYTSWHDYPSAILGQTEQPLLEWFSNNVKPGQTWLDVGAHYGYTSIALSRLVGETGRVFAFEPVCYTAGCVARTRALNNLACLHVIPLALSSDGTVGTRCLSVARGMADSTIPQRGWREPFLVYSLDSLWPTLSENAPKIHGIKIDVQGMEYEVLSGMRQVLTESRPKLVVEFHEGVDRKEILRLLRECGYNAAKPVNSAEAAGSFTFLDNQSYAFSPDLIATEQEQSVFSMASK